MHFGSRLNTPPGTFTRLEQHGKKDGIREKKRERERKGLLVVGIDFRGREIHVRLTRLGGRALRLERERENEGEEDEKDRQRG